MFGLVLYLHTLGVAGSVVLNALLAGRPTETLSYRSVLAREEGKAWGCVVCAVLDLIDPFHCTKTLLWWRERLRDSADASQIDEDARGLRP